MTNKPHIGKTVRLEFNANFSTRSEIKQINRNNINGREEFDYYSRSLNASNYKPRPAVFIDV